jgi:hypothetical protein
MTKWSKAGSPPKTDFAAAFFDRDGGDPVVTLLREAAETAASAKSQADLRDASTLLAAAEQKIGLDHLRGFVDDAVKRGLQFGEFARATRRTATDAGAASAPAKKGTAGRPPIVATGTPAPADPRGPRDFKRFFDTLDRPVSDLAKELGVSEDYILGHTVHESGYLDNHDFPLNNPFGYAKAGGT